LHYAQQHVVTLCFPCAALVHAAGESISEGGFAANRVSAASLLDVSEDTDKKGKKYYKYELLVRSGEETRAAGGLIGLVLCYRVCMVWVCLWRGWQGVGGARGFDLGVPLTVQLAAGRQQMSPADKQSILCQQQQ
jgi:hypothetical protein